MHDTGIGEPDSWAGQRRGAREVTWPHLGAHASHEVGWGKGGEGASHRSCPFIELSLGVSWPGSQNGRCQLSGSFFQGVVWEATLEEFVGYTRPRARPHGGETCPCRAQTLKTLPPPRLEMQLCTGLGKH